MAHTMAHLAAVVSIGAGAVGFVQVGFCVLLYYFIASCRLKDIPPAVNTTHRRLHPYKLDTPPLNPGCSFPVYFSGRGVSRQAGRENPSFHARVYPPYLELWLGCACFVS